MPALTGVGATGAPGTVTPRISIALTGVSATVQQGFMSKSSRPGESFDLTFPHIALALTGITGATGALDIEPPLPTLAMMGDVPVAASITLVAPRPGLQFTGLVGVSGTLALRAPRLAISFGDGGGLRLEAPLPTLAMVGGSGATAALTLRQALPTLALSGMTETIGRLTIAQPLPVLLMSTASGRIGTIDRQVVLPRLEMAGVVGTHGTLAIEQPLPELQFTGNYAATGALAIDTPAIRLVLQGITQGTTAQVAASRVTYVLQTERQALTKYTNFPFNSFAVFAGRYLGAGPDGIFELTGDTDAGTAIQAVARFGVTDLGSSRVKRVNHVYIGMRAPQGKKAMLLRVLTNETQQRDYGVKASISAGLHTTRVDLGQGVESRYWQFELRNRDGVDFSVDTVEVAPTPTRRRMGAKDA